MAQAIFECFLGGYLGGLAVVVFTAFTARGGE